MSYASQAYTGDGSTTEFVVPFPYLARNHVKVYLDDVLQVDGVGYTWPASDSVAFTTAPVNDAAILLQRETPRTSMITQFTAGPLAMEDLNKALQQLLFINQEALDDNEENAAVAEGILQYVDDVQTAVTDAQAAQAAAQAIADGLVAEAAWYDLIASFPYAPVLNEYIQSWDFAEDTTFDASEIARFDIFTNGAAPASNVVVRLYTRAGTPLADGVHLATGTITAGNQLGSWAAVAGDTSIPAGTKLALKATAVDATIAHLGVSVSFLRTPA